MKRNLWIVCECAYCLLKLSLVILVRKLFSSRVVYVFKRWINISQISLVAYYKLSIPPRGMAVLCNFCVLFCFILFGILYIQAYVAPKRIHSEHVRVKVTCGCVYVYVYVWREVIRAEKTETLIYVRHMMMNEIWVCALDCALKVTANNQAIGSNIKLKCSVYCCNRNCWLPFSIDDKAIKYLEAIHIAFASIRYICWMDSLKIISLMWQNTQWNKYVTGGCMHMHTDIFATLCLVEETVELTIPLVIIISIHCILHVSICILSIHSNGLT